VNDYKIVAVEEDENDLSVVMGLYIGHLIGNLLK